MPRVPQRSLLLLTGLWFLMACTTGTPDRPPTSALSAPQKDLAECLELASQVAQYPPSHARGRAARDRYLTLCLDSR
jgi:hypothetical protein